jgi:methyl-accepting chemotaxis protein
VVGGDLSLQTITDTINALNFNGMGYAFLISGDGKILVHPDKTLVMKYLKDIYPQDTPPSAALQRDQVNGKTRIVTFTPVKGLGSSTGTIGLSVDKDKAFAALLTFRTSAVIATVIAVIRSSPCSAC